MDGYGSYLTLEFDLICITNNDVIICMPIYLYYLLQPLDIGYFGILKHFYS
jgi:hypothetical protein